MNKIKLIYAKSEDNIIGDGNKLPWHLPDDLKYFKEQTGKDTVLMGRKTWESLPIKVRPLPGRKNIIITNTFNYIDNENVLVITDPIKYLKDHLAKDNNETIWVIGGTKIFNLALDFATEIYVTDIKSIIKKSVVNPIYGPVIDIKVFKLASSSDNKIDSVTGFNYKFNIYSRV